MSSIEKFAIHVPDNVLEDLKTRLALTRFPTELELTTGEEWSYGTPEKVKLPSETKCEAVHSWRVALVRLLEISSTTGARPSTGDVSKTTSMPIFLSIRRW